MSDNIEIGRILRASTAGFAVGCRVQQLQTPEFGGLVKALTADGDAIYGLIYDMHIDDDPLVRRLVLADDLQPSAIEDQRNNRLLPIEMSVLALAYTQPAGGIRYGLPPRPPLNLDPVEMVLNAAEITQLTDTLSYLRQIVRQDANRVPIDQLLVAHIRAVYGLRGHDEAWALAAVQEVIELLRSDYNTLIPTVEALSAAIVLPAEAA